MLSSSGFLPKNAAAPQTQKEAQTASPLRQLFCALTTFISFLCSLCHESCCADTRICQCHVSYLVLDASSTCKADKCAERGSKSCFSGILWEMAAHRAGRKALLISRLPNFPPGSHLLQSRSGHSPFHTWRLWCFLPSSLLWPPSVFLGNFLTSRSGIISARSDWTLSNQPILMKLVSKHPKFPCWALSSRE